MLLIDSVYINNSGGKVLLDELLESLSSSSIEVSLLSDIRYAIKPDLAEKITLVASVSSEKERRTFYKTISPEITKVLCFGNVPPPIKLTVPVYVYFHNINLLEIPSSLPLKKRLLLWLKKMYIKSRLKNADEYWVQSDNVKDVLIKRLSVNADQVCVYPFFKSYKGMSDIPWNSRTKNSFVYISNGNPHKNHSKLLDAWETLATRGVYPELHLTVTAPYVSLMQRIETLSRKGVKIYNHGFTDPAELYSKCQYLVYPSLAESFGLGLIESVQMHCKVVGADLPYLHAVIEPTFLFDPGQMDEIVDIVAQIVHLNTEPPKSLLKISNKLPEMLNRLA